MPADLLVGRVRLLTPSKNRPDLPAPLAQVLAQHRRLVRVGHLGGGEALGPAAHPQLALAGGAHVAHPLGLAPRGDQVALPSTVSGLTGVVRHSPLLRPRTASTRDPMTLIPARVSAPTVVLNMRSTPVGMT